METLIYFGVSGAALAFGLSLLRQKYILKTRRAQRDRGAFTVFAVFMFIFAAAAFAVGLAAQ